MLGECAVKINEIWGGGSLKGIGAELLKKAGGEQNWKATVKAVTPNAASIASQLPPSQQVAQNQQAPSAPEEDISKIVPAGKQFRFLNPELPGSFIIIRQDGYWQDRIPKHLAGQVKKVNGLYPVQREENIKKFNEFYNQAADTGKVIEEPVHAL